LRFTLAFAFGTFRRLLFTSFALDGFRDIDSVGFIF
jgi:hypothetical protein